jgi:hypothetical protein
MAEDDNTSQTNPQTGSIWPSSMPESVSMNPPAAPAAPEAAAPRPPEEAPAMPAAADQTLPKPPEGTGMGGRGPFGIFSPSDEADETPDGPAKDIIDLMVGITPGRVVNTFVPMIGGGVRELWDKAVQGTQDMFRSAPEPTETASAEPSSRDSAAALPPPPRGNNTSRRA